MAKILNALSFDLEEYFQVSNYAGAIPRESWDSIPSRLRIGTDTILRTLEAAGVHATFFILGWIAERPGDLVREIAERGHEIASHGFDHRLVYEMTPEELGADARRTLALLKPLAGKDRPVLGYRAPSFSITERSLWAFRVLAEEGFAYDSSIFPVLHTRYGIPNAPRFIHRR